MAVSKILNFLLYIIIVHLFFSPIICVFALGGIFWPNFPQKIFPGGTLFLFCFLGGAEVPKVSPVCVKKKNSASKNKEVTLTIKGAWQDENPPNTLSRIKQIETETTKGATKSSWAKAPDFFDPLGKNFNWFLAQGGRGNLGGVGGGLFVSPTLGGG